RLQGLARGDGLLELRAAGGKGGAIRDGVDGQLTRRIGIREPLDAVVAHARGELQRLVASGVPVVVHAAGTAGARLRRGTRTARPNTATMATAATSRTVRIIAASADRALRRRT